MSAGSEQTPDWLALLRQAVEDQKAKRNGKRGGIVSVARTLGYSRAAISLALRGLYDGDTRWIEAAVLKVYGGGLIRCPHLAATIRSSDCDAWQRKPMPRSNPEAIRHWHACAGCDFATQENLKERG